jgi:lipoyl(octanoyl) transferase
VTVIPSGVEESLTISEISRDVSTLVDMTKRLFVALNVYHDIASRSAALNMAIDEALLELAEIPTIRFYRWDHPALSFGYFGKFADVANHSAQRDLVRRWTGGGIVFHGEDLTYSIVIPASEPAFGESSVSIYEQIHNAIRGALAANGQSVELAANGAPKISDSCFANPVRADVMRDGQKIAGAAQRRTRRGLLQQGSIQDVDLTNKFADQFANELCSERYHKTLDERLTSRAHEIAEQKYGTQVWLRKR